VSRDGLSGLAATPASSSSRAIAHLAWTPRQRVKNAILVFLLATIYRALRLPARVFPNACRRLLSYVFRALVCSMHMARTRIARATEQAWKKGIAGNAPSSLANVHRRLCQTFAEIAVDTLAPEHQAFDVLTARAQALVDQRFPKPVPPNAEAPFPPAGIVVSLHLGNWERVGRTLAKVLPTFCAVTRRAYDPRLDVYYARLRKYPTLPVATRATHDVRAMMKHLRRGGILGVPMDLQTRAPSLTVTMLGQPARLPVGPVRLAKRLKTHLWVANLTPLGATKGTAVDLEELSLEGDEAAVLQRIADAFTSRIRGLPDHWLWPAAPFVDDQS
jgi:lauroyl/myristoyl acyltransferase